MGTQMGSMWTALGVCFGFDFYIVSGMIPERPKSRPALFPPGGGGEVGGSAGRVPREEENRRREGSHTPVDPKGSADIISYSIE